MRASFKPAFHDTDILARILARTYRRVGRVGDDVGVGVGVVECGLSAACVRALSRVGDQLNAHSTDSTHVASVARIEQRWPWHEASVRPSQTTVPLTTALTTGDQGTDQSSVN